MSEIENLLNALRNMKFDSSKIENTKELWEKIGKGEWEEAGFKSKEEMQQYILDNPYANLV